MSSGDCRQALVDHYSKLSAEAARREQKALWRVQRHRLESARLRFLLEEEKCLQVLQHIRVVPCPCMQTLLLAQGHSHLQVLCRSLVLTESCVVGVGCCVEAECQGSVLQSLSKAFPLSCWIVFQEMLRDLSEVRHPLEPPGVLPLACSEVRVCHRILGSEQDAPGLDVPMSFGTWWAESFLQGYVAKGKRRPDCISISGPVWKPGALRRRPDL